MGAYTIKHLDDMEAIYGGAFRRTGASLGVESFGLQVFDISNPVRPVSAGYYVPDNPKKRLGLLPRDLVHQAEDVIVDARGYIYVTEKNSGLYVMEFTPEG